MDNDTMTRAEVDYVWHEDGATLEEACAKVTEEFGLERVDVVREIGPAGGNPIVQLVGSPEAVERALRDGWYLDDEEVAMFLGNAE